MCLKEAEGVSLELFSYRLGVVLKGSLACGVFSQIEVESRGLDRVTHLVAFSE